jgi:hypothetical protein
MNDSHAAKVPGRIMDLGIWLMLKLMEVQPDTDVEDLQAAWVRGMEPALRSQAWCAEREAERFIEPTHRRVIAYLHALPSHDGQVEMLQRVTFQLRGGAAYVFAMVGSVPLGGSRSDEPRAETTLYNAFADILCGLAKVTRFAAGWTLPDTPKIELGPMPDPGPLALATLADRDPFYARMLDEWVALLPRLIATDP